MRKLTRKEFLGLTGQAAVAAAAAPAGVWSLLSPAEQSIVDILYAYAHWPQA